MPFKDSFARFTTPERTTYLILLGSVVFIMFVTLGVVLPSVHTIYETRDRVQGLRTVIEENVRRAQTLHKTVERLPELNSVVSTWNRTVLQRGEELALIRFLETAARQYAVAIKLIPSELPQRPNTILTSGIQLEIQASGTFTNFMSFLHAVDQSDYYINVQELRMQKLTGSIPRAERVDGENIIYARLKGEVYFTKTP